LERRAKGVEVLRVRTLVVDDEAARKAERRIKCMMNVCM
jgi:hypothetical protein